MKRLIQALAIITISLFIGNACNKPSTIGSDLLPDEDFIDLLFTDSLALNTSTVRGDTVQTYSPALSGQLSNYMCGRLDDPILGKSTSSMVVQFGITSKPVLNEPVLDSVVLLLAYSDDGHSGDLNAPQSFEVYRLEEDLISSQSYYSNNTFETGDKIGESPNAIPKIDGDILLDAPYIDTLGMLQYRDSLVDSHLRIKLEDSFGDSLLNFVGDSTFLGLADEFTQFFKGLHIRPSTHNTAMLRFNLSVVYSEIRLYYSEPDTSIIDMRPREIIFPVRSNSVKALSFSHDYQNSEVQNFLDSTVSYPEDFAFIQSMEGLATKIEFPGLEGFQDVAVNQAELIFTVVRDSDIDLFPLPGRIAAFQRNSEGQLNAIEDVINDLNSGGNLFNGNQTFSVRGGEKTIQYRMFVTSFLQGIIDDAHNENAIYLLPFDRGEQATRAILGGNAHNHYPVQLRLTYTKL